MGVLDLVAEERQKILWAEHTEAEKLITLSYYQEAARIADGCTVRTGNRETLTSKLDRIILHRFFGPLFLLGIIYLLYELSIVQGYNLTNYTWPLLAGFRGFVAGFLPPEGLLFDPVSRALVLYVLDGILAVLNYIPIFLILFTLVAILEDVGYIPRMTFIMDRIFRRFGLHGQSVFPMVLGGLFVGGCAIPGVMATRGIKDEKARLATILVVPLMNCLAKTPLYILLIGLFFSEHKGFAFFFVSTVSLIIALCVSKVFSLTILRRKKPAPFVMEMPPYHLPSVSVVFRRCIERLWLFIKKIVSVVVAVMILVFAFTNLPGLSKEQKLAYERQGEELVAALQQQIGAESPYAEALRGEKLTELIKYNNDFKEAKKRAGETGRETVERTFAEINPVFYKIANRGIYLAQGQRKRDREAAEVFQAFNRFERKKMDLRARLKEETLIYSILGRIGRGLEPVTAYAGFDWRINIALISAFAAKESSVATLGGIYQSDTGASLEESVAQSNTGWTPLHVLAMMVFMVLFPPCIPTLLAVRMESGSSWWMLFGAVYPMVLGLLLGIIIFTGGNLLGLTGLQAMVGFYVLMILTMFLLSLIKDPGAEDLEENME